jgi:hypothetical protein
MAAVFQTPPKAVQAQACCFRCDCCHVHLGTRFIHHWWACEACRLAILAALLKEAYD